MGPKLVYKPRNTYSQERSFSSFGLHYDGLAGTFAGLAAIIGVYVTWRNLRQTREDIEKQIEVVRKGQEQTDKNAQKTLRLTEKGQITERFTHAIEQLGATDDKEGTPKLEIRLGGIYALEHIAKDSPTRAYYTVMEVLTAYIRENAPWPTKEDKETPVPPADIQAIVDVFRRREKDPELDEPPVHIELYRVQLNLQRTNLYGADFWRADLQGANLQGTFLQQSDLRAAQLQEATLQEADLTQADLRGANLRGANLQEAYFRWAYLQGANLQGTEGLTEEQIKDAFGDRNTVLPNGVDPPLKWSKTTEEQTNENE